MNESVRDVIEGSDFYARQFGKHSHIIDAKRKMLREVWRTFKRRFPSSERIYLITVPNRVELLGKHTDYQGGETLLLTGPKNFFAIAAAADDGLSELVNLDPRLGETCLKLGRGDPEMLEAGVGANFTLTVAERLTNNLADVGFLPLENVKAVFAADIPFGGGTSGSSAKLITDFFILTSANGLLKSDRFISLVIENATKSGLKLSQRGVDDFSLALSMYVAHHENGLDFGELKGDRGVGTFGGSEDHTAILLGKRDRALYCRYCPTQIIEALGLPENCHICVAYSGKKAEKTGDAKAGFNRLSLDARSAVRALNRIAQSQLQLLRDFFPSLPAGKRADIAYNKLARDDESLAERVFQFFKERELTERAVACLKTNDLRGYGRLLNQSHDLSKKYLRNIAQEVDFLQRSANELGALGASGFGAGFGGSCYAVVDSSRSDEFLERWKTAYTLRYPHFRSSAQFDLYPACNGSHSELLEV